MGSLSSQSSHSSGGCSTGQGHTNNHPTLPPKPANTSSRPTRPRSNSVTRQPSQESLTEHRHSINSAETRNSNPILNKLPEEPTESRFSSDSEHLYESISISPAHFKNQHQTKSAQSQQYYLPHPTQLKDSVVRNSKRTRSKDRPQRASMTMLPNTTEELVPNESSNTSTNQVSPLFIPNSRVIVNQFQSNELSNQYQDTLQSANQELSARRRRRGEERSRFLNERRKKIELERSYATTDDDATSELGRVNRAIRGRRCCLQKH